MTSLASSPQETDKLIFAEQCKNIVQNDNVLKIEQSVTQDYDDVYNAIKKFVSNDLDGVREIIMESTTSTETLALVDNSNVTYEEFENYLNSNGVFIYSEETSDVTPLSTGSQDVSMSKAMITYNSSTDEWILIGGGYWYDGAYDDDMPSAFFGYLGKVDNVGGLDAVGVAMYQASGTLPTLNRCSGYVHDGNGNNMSLSNPCNLDSTRGVVFEFQDYRTIIQESPTDYTYMGYGFAAQAVYDSSFAQYHGKAKSYYAHTWEEASIDSIGISVDGFSISWTADVNRWFIYNNSDTTF